MKQRKLGYEKVEADIAGKEASTELTNAEARRINKLSKSIGVQKEPTELEKEEVKKAKLDNIALGLKNAVSHLPAVTRDSYGDYHNWIIESNFVPKGTFASPNDVAKMTPLEFKAYKSSLTGLQTLDSKGLAVLEKKKAAELVADAKVTSGKLSKAQELLTRFTDKFETEDNIPIGLKPAYSAALDIVNKHMGAEQTLETEQEPILEQDEQVRPDPLLTSEEAVKGLGPIAAMKQFANNTLGAFIEGQPFPETEEARNKIYTFNQRMRPFLQVSARGAKFDVENINKILPNPDKFWQDPDASKSKLANLYNVIELSIAEKTRLMDSTGTTGKQHRDFSNEINTLREALSILPQPGNKQSNIYENMALEEALKIDTKTLTNQQRIDLERRVDILLEE